MTYETAYDVWTTLHQSVCLAKPPLVLLMCTTLLLRCQRVKQLSDSCASRVITSPRGRESERGSHARSITYSLSTQHVPGDVHKKSGGEYVRQGETDTGVRDKFLAMRG
eukprot:168352-Chlamydomonas_euryale.AAC.1